MEVATARQDLVDAIRMLERAGFIDHSGHGSVRRDADSFDLLEIAIGRLTGRPVNVDATLICEQPRLDAHREEMERNLSTALSAPVSVKATTNEGMGALGRGEGIACMAVALIET